MNILGFDVLDVVGGAVLAIFLTGGWAGLRMAWRKVRGQGA